MIRKTLLAVVACNVDVGTHSFSVWISSLKPILVPIWAQLLLWSRRRRRSLLLSLFDWSRLLRFFDWCRLLCLFYWSRSRRLLSCWRPELEGLVESRDKFALVTGCPREEFHGRERDRTIIQRTSLQPVDKLDCDGGDGTDLTVRLAAENQKAITGFIRRNLTFAISSFVSSATAWLCEIGTTTVKHTDHVGTTLVAHGSELLLEREEHLHRSFGHVACCLGVALQDAVPGVVHEDQSVLAYLLVHADFQVQVSHFGGKGLEVGVHDYLNLVLTHSKPLQPFFCVKDILVDRIQVAEACVALLLPPKTVVVVADKHELALVRYEEFALLRGFRKCMGARQSLGLLDRCGRIAGVFLNFFLDFVDEADWNFVRAALLWSHFEKLIDGLDQLVVESADDMAEVLAHLLSHQLHGFFSRGFCLYHSNFILIKFVDLKFL